MIAGERFEEVRVPHSDGANDRECDLPDLRRHGVFYDAMSGAIASNCGRCNEDERDQHSRPKRPHNDQQELLDAERECRADKTDNDGAEPTSAGVIGPHARIRERPPVGSDPTRTIPEIRSRREV